MLGTMSKIIISSYYNFGAYICNYEEGSDGLKIYLAVDSKKKTMTTVDGVVDRGEHLCRQLKQTVSHILGPINIRVFYKYVDKMISLDEYLDNLGYTGLDKLEIKRIVECNAHQK